MKQSTTFAQVATNLLNVLQGYTKGIRFTTILTLLFTLGVGSMLAAEGDVLKSYDTNSSTFASGYSRKTGDNFVWWGQKGYYGANNATNHGNLKPTAADLPVVKAHNSSATTSTTGLYYLYTSEAVANVGKIEVSFTAKSGSSTVNAYVVSSSTKAASGSATWTKVTLASNSSKAQGANVASAGTYTFTFDATETDAKYYGVVFVTSSYWRATNLTFKLYEGASAPATPYIVTLKDDNSTLTQSTAGAAITLPSRDGCKDYTFAGWTKGWDAPQTSWTTTDPTIIPAGSYTPTADENLYPVYTKTEGGTPVPATLTASYSSHSGWTATGCGGSSYWVLKQDASITSPVISDLSTVTSITFKVRTYGGSTYNTVNVSTSGGTSIGSATASNTTLTLKTINVSPKLSGSGSIVFSSTTTSSSNGPGIN